jgi:protein FRG1
MSVPTHIRALHSDRGVVANTEDTAVGNLVEVIVLLRDPPFKMPIKPLSFKGDKKTSSSKKRKHREERAEPDTEGAPATDDNDDDTWLSPDQPSDLTGPTLLILPTTPPTALASDANGNVFASQIENLIEGRPETAEPHDVRQVWVANQIPGTEGGQMSFRGSHGGYLSCDTLGILGAKREARGAEEGFVLVEASGGGRGKWRLRIAAVSSSKDTEKPEPPEIKTKDQDEQLQQDDGHCYLAAITEGKEDPNDDSDSKPPTTKKISISLRGDQPSTSLSTLLHVKMQARFKPRVQQLKATAAHEKISRAELEHAVGRKLDHDEVKRLKRARRDGTYYEEVLDVRVKGKHDKFA